MALLLAVNLNMKCKQQSRHEENTALFHFDCIMSYDLSEIGILINWLKDYCTCLGQLREMCVHV